MPRSRNHQRHFSMAPIRQAASLAVSRAVMHPNVTTTRPVLLPPARDPSCIEPTDRLGRGELLSHGRWSQDQRIVSSFIRSARGRSEYMNEAMTEFAARTIYLGGMHCQKRASGSLRNGW